MMFQNSILLQAFLFRTFQIAHFQMVLLAKMTICPIYNCNLQTIHYLINVRDIVDFLGLKVINS